MQALLDLLFTSTWWRYDPEDRSLFSVSYRTFNFVEGAVWIAFGVLVLLRFRKHRRSRLELWYAAAFVLFGLTDFREAQAMQSWLLWTKLAVLIVLLVLRKTVMRRYHPESRVY
jgi:hypothetical protein